MFYKFRQNNSGDRFRMDDKRGIGVIVFIEADNADHANDRAESIGVYFDGVRGGRDCDCCGDRWTSASVYEQEAGDPKIHPEYDFRSNDKIYVHMKDGRIVRLTQTNCDIVGLVLAAARAGVDIAP